MKYPVLQGSIESKGAFFIRLKIDGYTLFTIDYKNVTSSPCFLKVNIALEKQYIIHVGELCPQCAREHATSPRKTD